jgi:signal peptidase II
VSSERRLRLIYAGLALGVVVVDQIVKLVVDRLLVLHESHELIAGLLQLTYVRNRGAAFGFFNDFEFRGQVVVFSIISVAAQVAIAFYAYRLAATRRLPQTALALILGGAVGNLLDRLVRGYVIDFVDVYWKSHHWPMFNVADSAISVGVGLLVLDMLRDARESESDPSPDEGSPAASPTGRAE